MNKFLKFSEQYINLSYVSEIRIVWRRKGQNSNYPHRLMVLGAFQPGTDDYRSHYTELMEIQHNEPHVIEEMFGRIGDALKGFVGDPIKASGQVIDLDQIMSDSERALNGGKNAKNNQKPSR